jgi:hypothetical protein
MVLVCPVDHYSTLLDKNAVRRKLAHHSGGHVMPQHVYALHWECGATDSDTQVPSATFASTLDEEKNTRNWALSP